MESKIKKGEVGRKVAHLAKALGITQKEIANTCQISRMSIHRFFKGETELKAKEFLKVLEILGLFSEEEMNYKIQQKLNGNVAPSYSTLIRKQDKPPFIFS